MNFYEVLFALKKGAKGFVNHYETLFANALNGDSPTPTLSSITAVFNQGTATIYDTDTLDSLKQYLTVTATYSDSTTETVTTYTLSGTLVVGTSTITVSYGGKTTSFIVTVSSDLVWRYLPSMGKLTDQTFASFNAGTLVVSEDIVDGSLRLYANAQASSNNNGILLTPPSYSTNAYLKVVFKIASISYYAAETTTSATGVFVFRISNGSSGTNAGFAKYGSVSASPRLRRVVGSTAAWDGETFTMDEWHTLEIINENSKQTIKIDGTVIVNNANLSTSYTTANAIYLFGNNNSIPLEVYINEMEYRER
jgi:hypothetical protein